LLQLIEGIDKAFEVADVAWFGIMFVALIVFGIYSWKKDKDSGFPLSRE